MLLVLVSINLRKLQTYLHVHPCLYLNVLLCIRGVSLSPFNP